jgi:hypothetical protein
MINLNYYRWKKIEITAWMTLPVLLSLLTMSDNVSAQEFAIKKIEISAELITLHYDLIDTVHDHTYTVYVYSSRDNFLVPLEKLSGDHGLRVRPGENRKIVWKAKEDLGATFEGDVELEIRGRIYIPFLHLEKFKDSQLRKRGFLVKWSGGSSNNILNFQLHRSDGKLVHTFENIANAREHKFVIPSSVRPGTNYYFRISDSKNKDQAVESQTFRIKRRVPQLLKVVATFVAGGIIYYLVTREDKKIDGPPDHP